MMTEIMYSLTMQETKQAHNERTVYYTGISQGFPGGTGVKNPPANTGDTRDTGSIHELGRSPGVGNSNPLQYSCLENSKDRGAWWATVHGVAKISLRKPGKESWMIKGDCVFTDFLEKF